MIIASIDDHRPATHASQHARICSQIIDIIVDFDIVDHRVKFWETSMAGRRATQIIEAKIDVSMISVCFFGRGTKSCSTEIIDGIDDDRSSKLGIDHRKHVANRRPSIIDEKGTKSNEI
ncbi:MAG: hypothetical protein P4L81_02595 [Candidatus Pacebacteria bacterium]|nr:hypothetical protein [Candidatus Paceibacterota bacterium]